MNLTDLQTLFGYLTPKKPDDSVHVDEEEKKIPFILAAVERIIPRRR